MVCLLVMLLGAMPEESAADGLMVVPTAKTRATDFSIAAIMAKGAVAPPDARDAHADGQSFHLLFKILFIYLFILIIRRLVYNLEA